MSQKLKLALILIAVAVVLIVFGVVFLKYKNSRKIIGYGLGAILLISAIPCGIGLYKEVKAESYVVGSLSVKTEYEVENFSYISSGLVLYNDTYSSDDTWSFETKVLRVSDFDGEENNYAIVLNNYTLLESEVFPGSISAKFYLNQYDTDGSLKNFSVLDITIKFLRNETVLSFSTEGEQSARFLEQYFQDYGLTLKIIQIKE